MEIVKHLLQWIENTLLVFGCIGNIYSNPVFMSPQIAAENKLILKNYWSYDCGYLSSQDLQNHDKAPFLEIISVCEIGEK